MDGCVTYGSPPLPTTSANLNELLWLKRKATWIEWVAERERERVCWPDLALPFGGGGGRRARISVKPKERTDE